MATTINQVPNLLALSRSPIIVTIEQTDGGIITTDGFRYLLDVFVWTGVKASIPATQSHRLIKPINPNNVAAFDIKDFARAQIEPLTDFIATTGLAEGVNQAVNVYVEAGYINDVSGVVIEASGTVFNVTDGYTLFSEGVNANKTDNNGQFVLSDFTELYVYDNHYSPLTFFRESASDYIHDIYWDNLTDTTGITNIEVTSTTNEDCLLRVPLNKSFIEDDISGTVGDRLYVELRDSGGDPFKTFYVNYVCEPKYDVYTVYFTNRYGVIDFLHFFKKSSDSISSTRQDYESSIAYFNPSDDLAYNDELPQIQDYLVDGNRSIMLNTGFQSEGIKSKIEQLILSQFILLYDGTSILPVRCTTSSAELQKAINDRVINYTMSFKYANQIVNNIR